jgi:hypothetical protein
MNIVFSCHSFLQFNLCVSLADQLLLSTFFFFSEHICLTEDVSGFIQSRQLYVVTNTVSLNSNLAAYQYFVCYMTIIYN